MTTQTEMFSSSELGTHPVKLARRDGPDTSHVAAKSVDTSKLERLVLETIKGFGEHGCISDDVLSAYSNLPYSSVTARYRALLDKGLIEDAGERRPGKSGKPQRVMRYV
jgi:DNA-binding transcriptional ArsR family regulator